MSDEEEQTSSAADDDRDPHVLFAENGAMVLFPHGLAYYAEQVEVDMLTVDPDGGVWHYKDGRITPAGELVKKLKSVQ